MKIVLEHLTKVFTNKKTGSEVRAVDDMNLTIESGTLVGLLGPSGCGKSTTLFMLSGLQSPTGGKIIFGESDVTQLEPQKRGIGLVFQNYALYPHMTVEDNIKFPLQNMKVNKKEIAERVVKTAKLVQIDNLLDRKPSELSGGQQQRVAIARALVKMPDVLLLDEPLSNLDARLRLQTREEIRRIQQETGITTVFVTHDQEEAMSISDVIVVMKLGVVQQVGKPQDIYDNPCNLFVAKFLGTPPINVFTGKIEDGYVYIGEQKIMATKLENQEIYVAVRPEGFIVDNKKGVFTCQLQNVEVMGREKSIICTHAACEKPTIRAIVEEFKHNGENTVSFSFKKNKVFLFNRETEVRLDTPEEETVKKPVRRAPRKAKTTKEEAERGA